MCGTRTCSAQIGTTRLTQSLSSLVLNQRLSLNSEVIDRLDWLSSQLREPSWLCLPSSGVTDAHNLPGFCVDARIQTQVLTHG